jgi:hypothetical protein
MKKSEYYSREEGYKAQYVFSVELVEKWDKGQVNSTIVFESSPLKFSLCTEIQLRKLVYD